MAAQESYVTPRTFRFLAELDNHNDREWFNANKQRYIDDVRDPLLRFVEAFAPRLEKISPHMLADPRPSGGSLFRIYRDTRFSKDKRPYKSQAALGFRHVDGKDVQGPVFYLHVEPGNVFGAAGIWHPSSDTLKQVRDAIVENPQDWKRATRGRGRALDEGGERLVRAPRGYDPEHPLVEDLKAKGYVRSTRFTQKDTCASDFPARFAKACRQSSPLMEFLADAVGLDW